MPAAFMEQPTVHRDEQSPCRVGVRRTAFYLQSGGKSLFVWLHESDDVTLSHGVLICPPIGHEQVHSHRSLRHLADALAAKGFSVLRLDYQGVGDSEGDPEDAGLYSAWQENVRDAAEWLRRENHCESISIVGLRVGAMLATLHAAEHEVDHLVLWSPIVSGRRFVRELKALSLVAQRSADADSSNLEAMGFVYTQEMLHDLGQIDLATIRPRCESILIAHNDCVPQSSPLVQKLVLEGVPVDQVAFPGYEQMMAEPHQTEVPETAIAGITDWLFKKQDVAETSKIACVTLPDAAPALRESAHWISRSPDLFGVMTFPKNQTSTLPWIIILNAGSAYRVGPGRLHVRLARKLSALGFPCLRVDISGLGDSPVELGREENDGYAATAFRDVAIVFEYLRRLDPERPMLLMGLCSGAYAAFQSAAQLPHPELIESILLNPLVFYWKEGMTIEDSPTERLSAWHEYRKAIFKWENWRQLLSGKTQMGFKGSVRQFAQRLLPRRRPAVKGGVTKPSASNGSEYGHPAKNNLAADLSRIASASRRLAIFISDNDPGYFLLFLHGNRKGKQLMSEGIRHAFFMAIPDPPFSKEGSRVCLSRVLTDYLQSRFGFLSEDG